MRLFVTLIAIAIHGHRIVVNGIDDQDFIWKPMVEISNQSFVNAFLPNYVNFADEVFHSNTITFECKTQLQSALDALTQRRNWAAKLFNSWAKFPPSGMLQGTLTDYGDYDQCLSLASDAIVSQYCLVDISIPMPRPMPMFHNYFQEAKVLPENDDKIEDGSRNQVKMLNTNETIYSHLASVSSVFYYAYIQIGICLPRGCIKQDVANITTIVVQKLGLELNKFQCESKSNSGWNFNSVQLSAIILIASMLIVTISAAIYDRFVIKKYGTFLEYILLCYSPVRNTKKLIYTKSSDELTCIHGLRFLTIVWIIIGHTLEWNNLNIFRDTFSIRDKLSEFSKQPLYKGHYSVETFFYLSGLLTSYVTLKYTNGEYRNFRYGSFLILRYLRLTPQLLAFFMLTSLLPPMFDGPLWLSYMSKLTDRCYTNWWHNLLFLQNLIDIENICAVHTWYLAADMQLHWLSLLLVVFILRNRTQGIALTKMFIVGCITISGFTIFTQNLPPGSVITSKNNFLDEQGKPSPYISFFYKPWNHANVFLIGFIFGDYLYRTNLKEMKLKKTTKNLLWFSCLCCYLFCIYSTAPWLFGRPYEPIWSAILFPLNGCTWSIMLTLVVWLCLTNNGSGIGRLLCWTGFRPLSRMTYSVYLTHAWVLYVALGTRRELIDLNTRSIILLCSGVVSVSFVVGFLFTIVFETPLFQMVEYVKRNWLERKTNWNKPDKVTSASVDENNEMRLLAIHASKL